MLSHGEIEIYTAIHKHTLFHNHYTQSSSLAKTQFILREDMKDFPENIATSNGNLPVYELGLDQA